MNKREAYYHLRHAYRLARRSDRAWRANPYAARNNIQRAPDTAGQLLAILPKPMADAITSRPAAVVPVERGPRAKHYVSWRPQFGMRHNLNLHQRVAVRRALLQSAALDEERSLSHTTRLPLLRECFWIEGGNMRLAAENARMRREQGLDR